MNIIKSFEKTYKNIHKNNIVKKTPLQYIDRLSSLYNSNIYFKREDLQTVRSFKIRGAYNKIINELNYNKKILSITSASAGNHAQGVSYVCNKLKINHNIFVPNNTPLQKINNIKKFGGEYLNLIITGNNFDNCAKESLDFCNKNNSTYVHPFNDNDVIYGQGTISYEIYNHINPDYIIVPIGGGGLISGISLHSKNIDKNCKIIGIEPENANSMDLSINNNKITSVKNLDTFVDGASVKTVGDLTFDYGKKYIDKIFTISNNKLCHNIIDSYQNEGIILEPAGALSISILDEIKDELKNKNVVCIISGGNNDILRYSEILEKSYQYNKLKHYFLVDFNQSPGQLKYFINNVIYNNIDICRFEYLKKTNKNMGTVLIGFELSKKDQIIKLKKNMYKYNYNFIEINEEDLLYSYLI